ncbi:TetR family transcriptional regulator [Paraburkholderia sp. Ac-20340]|uniref:TetR family transcriptional regulator n=1 Tax=Paraburkholderia sp. Ac-20340 TaxID=2703888 RepID=UPI00197FFB29|nr:TetR family transcriptional regulator [Paraburkholderia sp. Ac-20340]MBN3858781.1 TetR family transcriptional regulator [Paraburkholderia sp. Ac-20340]
MAKRTKEAAQETRTRLLDSAETLFALHGVSHTTLADIADAASLTRGAIYGHFRNKADLLEALLERTRLPLEELIGAFVDPQAQAPLAAMQRAILVCLRDAQCDARRRRVAEIVFNRCELVDDMAPVASRMREYARDGLENLERGLSNAKHRKQLAPTLDVRLAAALLHAQVSGLIRDNLLMPQHVDFVRDGAAMVAAMFEMLQHVPALHHAPPRASDQRTRAPRQSELRASSTNASR